MGYLVKHTPPNKCTTLAFQRNPIQNRVITTFFVKFDTDHFKQPVNTLAKVGQDQYLSFYRSIQAKVSCVYGVVTDHINRRIILTFRGSQNPDFSTRDWRSNFNIRLAEMKTPKRIRDKLDSPLNGTVSVHRGFYGEFVVNTSICHPDCGGVLAEPS